MPRVSDPDLLRQWTERFEQFQQSQQTIEQFCRSVGCSVTTFYYWKKKLQPRSSPKTTKPAENASAFLPVLVRGGGSRSIRIRTHEGIRIAVPVDALAALELILRHAQRVA